MPLSLCTGPPVPANLDLLQPSAMMGVGRGRNALNHPRAPTGGACWLRVGAPRDAGARGQLHPLRVQIRAPRLCWGAARNSVGTAANGCSRVPGELRRPEPGRRAPPSSTGAPKTARGKLGRVPSLSGGLAQSPVTPPRAGGVALTPGKWRTANKLEPIRQYVRLGPPGRAPSAGPRPAGPAREEKGGGM